MTDDDRLRLLREARDMDTTTTAFAPADDFEPKPLRPSTDYRHPSRAEQFRVLAWGFTALAIGAWFAVGAVLSVVDAVR